MTKKPQVNSAGEKELDKVQSQLDHFNEEVQSMTLDAMNKAPLSEFDPQVKKSTRELKGMDAPYIKPIRSIDPKEGFNEKYRSVHAKAWEYVKCVVENMEIIGEQVEMWTKRFAGDPAHFWKIPVNKPIYIPRLVAEQLSKCKYHRLRMDETSHNSSDNMATYYGTMTVDETRNRIRVMPVDNPYATVLQ